jgi:NADPH-dependent glutamate synthase beta subunit-like oxidoreductase
MTVTKIIDSTPVEEGLAGKIAKKFGVTEDKLEKVVDDLVAGNSPVLISFCFNPANGQIEQVAVSQVEMLADNYNALSKICARMADNFQNIALQLAKKEASAEKVEEAPNE